MVQGALFGCTLLVIVGFKFFGKYIFENPCEGSGNFREPLDYGYDDEETGEQNESYDSIEEEIKKLSKMVYDLKRR